MAGYEIERLQDAISDNVFINKIGQTDRARLLAAGNIIDARAINKNRAMEAYQAQSAHGTRDIKSIHGEKAAGAADNIGFLSAISGKAAERTEGMSFEEMLKSKYPGAYYNVMDTSKIDSGLWGRNDYPWNAYFKEPADESVLSWKPSGPQPDMQSPEVHAKMNSMLGKVAIVIPPELEEKMKNDPELAKKVMDRIDNFILTNEASQPGTLKGYVMTFDENGEMNHACVVGEGRFTVSSSEFVEARKAREAKHAEYERIAEENALRQKLLNEVSEPDTKGTEIEHRQFIQEYIDKLFVKIENGDTESTDETQGEDRITDIQVNMLVSETVQARFPLEEVDEEGNRKEDMYLITVDKDGIHCSKPGQDKYEWEILFTDESQYEKAIEFLNYAGEFMDNFRFAAHENFWEDYLNGNMDVDGFKEFLEGTNNGIPDYSFTVGDSMYIDKEKAQWAQYMNPLGAKFYTAEEMAKMQAELIEKNTATLHKLSAPYSLIYKKLVDPEYNGERIFCEYPGGPLYTADEIMEVMNRNLKDAKYQAEARK